MAATNPEKRLGIANDTTVDIASMAIRLPILAGSATGLGTLARMEEFAGCGGKPASISANAATAKRSTGHTITTIRTKKMM
jgi:hypothetical protein